MAFSGILSRQIYLLALLCFGLTIVNVSHAEISVDLEEFPSIPTINYGASIGISGGAIIVAGGLDAPLENSGTTVDDVFVLTPGANEWLVLKLDEPVAYAEVIAYEQGILVVGGIGVDGVSNSIVRLSWSGGQLIQENFAPLPVPLLFAGAAVLDNVLVVAGGQSALESGTVNQLMFRKSLLSELSEWESLELTDDFPTLDPIVVVQKDIASDREALYALARSESELTEDQVQSGFIGTKFTPGTGMYAGSRPISAPDAAIQLVSGQPIGPSHMVFTTESADHLMLYHAITDTWIEIDVNGESLDGDIIAFGEDLVFIGNPGGDHGGSVHLASIRSAKSSLSTIDFVVIFVYLGSLIWIGALFSKNEKTTDDFFLGGRKIPTWAAAVSMYATGVSAISFMATPAKTYSTDWLYIIMAVLPLFSFIVAGYLFIPLLRRLNITTMMEFLEMRFDRSIRTLTSVLTILVQLLARMGVIMLLPAIALSAVTGINVTAAILIMGVLATIYTYLGGFGAVVWTDVVQVFVMVGSALLSLVLIINSLPGGFGELIDVAVDYDRLRMVDFSFDFTSPTLVVFMFWFFGDIFYRLNQETLQRALATGSVKSARRSMILSGLIGAPGNLIFFGLGTALFAFYHAYPGLLVPTLETDAIFPLYISQQLPVGVAGLVVAGLFAASMSTLDSAMNTVATISVTDYYSRYDTDAPQKTRLKAARMITLIVGTFGTGIAVLMSMIDISSLWDLATQILSLLTGCMAGIYMLALLTRRASAHGTWLGFISAFAVLFYMKLFSELSFFLYVFVGLIVCFSVGYLASMVLTHSKSTEGLTVWPSRHSTISTTADKQ